MFTKKFKGYKNHIANYHYIKSDQSYTFVHTFNTKSQDKFDVNIRFLVGWYVNDMKILYKNVRVLHHYNHLLIEPRHNIIYNHQSPQDNLLYHSKTIEASLIAYINKEIKELSYVMNLDDMYKLDFEKLIHERIGRFLCLCGINIDLVHNESMSIKRNE